MEYNKGLLMEIACTPFLFRFLNWVPYLRNCILVLNDQKQILNSQYRLAVFLMEHRYYLLLTNQIRIPHYKKLKAQTQYINQSLYQILQKVYFH